MKKPKKTPRDPNQLAKQVVDLSTDEAPPEPDSPAKNPHAQALGRLGGAKGGKARAAKLTPAKRAEIARKAAAARWAKKKSKAKSANP
jgi:hypothetical protein